MSTVTEPTTSTFHSKFVSFRLVLVPTDQDHDARGRVVKTYPGVAVTFDNHEAKVEPATVTDPCEFCESKGFFLQGDGEEKQRITCPKCDGEGSIQRAASRISAESGMQVFDMPYEEVLTRLRSHKDYKTVFWQVGDAPGQLHPSIAERTKQIIRAAAKGDREGLEAVLADERDTHNRDEVLEHGAAALETLSEG